MAQENNLATDNIYGKWRFIKAYPSKLDKIDTILNDTILQKFPVFITYSKDGTFKFQSCYIESGSFEMGKKNSIKQHHKNGDGEIIITVGKITY